MQHTYIRITVFHDEPFQTIADIEFATAGLGFTGTAGGCTVVSAKRRISMSTPIATTTLDRQRVLDSCRPITPAVSRASQSPAPLTAALTPYYSTTINNNSVQGETSKVCLCNRRFPTI